MLNIISAEDRLKEKRGHKIVIYIGRRSFKRKTWS